MYTSKFKNEYGKAVEKHNSRMFKFKHYKGQNLLSLSSQTLLFETLVLRNYNKKQVIHCVERDSKVFELMKQIIRNRFSSVNPNMKCFNMDIFDVSFSQYGFVDLDLMCQLNVGTVNQIIKSLQSFKGTVCITLIKAREPFTLDELISYGTNYKRTKGKTEKQVRLVDFRYNTFPRLVETFTEMKFIETHEYKNTSKSSPMITYVFKHKTIK